jgi:dTMP kinase
VTVAKGRFITVEGIDGAGKSTHLPWLGKCIERRGVGVVHTREPGGTALGEGLRSLLLNQHMSIHTEVLLMFAARREHLHEVVWPAINRGEWVLCDRFTDASFAYQGAGRGLPIEQIEVLANWVHPGFAPDLTVWFDSPVAVARARLAAARTADRFEREDPEFFDRVRAGYLERMTLAPQRIRQIDSTRTIPEIEKQLEELVLNI